MAARPAHLVSPPAPSAAPSPHPNAALRRRVLHSAPTGFHANANSHSSAEETSELDFDTDASTSSAASSDSSPVKKLKRRRKVPSSRAASALSHSTTYADLNPSLWSWLYSFLPGSPIASSAGGVAKKYRSGSNTKIPRSIPRNLSPPRELTKKTLVLDLDETLVHSTSMGSRHHDHIIEVLVDKHVCLYYVYKRPGVDAFLKKVSEWYKVVIFTASMPEYADPVIDWLDKDRTLISRRYFRQSCIPSENGHFTKDLSIVEPDLASVVLLDNSPVSFAVNPENAIPIETWTHDGNDEALFELLPFLDALRFADDVRSILSLRI
ncbi:NLI interacting factor-like phosphatase-domain-containing protein [Chytriomyces sp. MP71]|nr:NLI interacting factor-like phosphatase-domain-containing protein [Chytriomyces sp. MP71]